MPSVFISYSRRDQGFVRRLHEALRARDYDVWVDWEDIPPSTEWFDEIRAGLDGADAFVFVISPNSVRSEVCTRELSHAVDQRKRIVPVLYEEPPNGTVPEAAAERNWVLLRATDDFEAGVQQLVTAVETDFDYVRVHTRLGVAASRWQASGEDGSQLLRGSELADAEAWLVAAAGKQPEPTQLQRQYVLASRQAATRRHRAVIAAVSLALVVAVVLAIVALIQRSTAIQERNVALARQLDAQAANQYSSDPELSVLLAERAARIAPGTATTEALREALGQSHVRVRYDLVSPHEPPVSGDALWSPDHRRLLVTSPQHWARVYSPFGDAAPVVLGSAPSSHGQSAWDARGDRVALGGRAPAVYDAASGRLVARVPGHALDVALTPDGTRLVTVDVNSVGHVYSLPDARVLASYRPAFHRGTSCFALSPDGTAAAQCDVGSFSANGASALDTWDVRSGRRLASVRVNSLIGSVAFSPDGARYAFTAPVSEPQGGRPLPGTFVYETRSGKRVIDFPGPGTAVAFSPSLRFPELAYATLGDSLVHVYDFTSGTGHVLTGSTDAVDSVGFSQGGAFVVAASRDRSARIWNASTGGLPVETLAGHQAPVLAAAFGLDDTMLATSSQDGTVRLWTTPTPRASVTLPASSSPHLEDATASTVGFSADGSRIVEASADGIGRVLDAHGLGVLARFAAPPGQGFAGGQLSRDGGVVAALSAPYTPGRSLGIAHEAELYSARSGALLRLFKPGNPLIGGTLDRADTRLATFGIDGSTDEWDLNSGRLLHRLPGSGAAAAAAFSADGSRLAVVHYPKVVPPTVTAGTVFGDVTLDVFDSRSGLLERAIAVRPLNPEAPLTAIYAPLTVAFSPDGQLLAVSGADQVVDVYRARSGLLIRSLGIAGTPGGGFVSSLAFSPDGKLLAAGAITGAYLWRVPSFTAFPVFQHVATGDVPPFVGGGFGVHVGFTSDSRFLLTSGDLTLAAWDPVDHLQLFKDYPVKVGSLSPNGREFVAASASGLALYPCELCGSRDQLLVIASKNTTRQLTASERALYLSQQ